MFDSKSLDKIEAMSDSTSLDKVQAMSDGSESCDKLLIMRLVISIVLEAIDLASLVTDRNMVKIFFFCVLILFFFW